MMSNLSESPNRYLYFVSKNGIVCCEHNHPRLGFVFGVAVMETPILKVAKPFQ